MRRPEVTPEPRSLIRHLAKLLPEMRRTKRGLAMSRKFLEAPGENVLVDPAFRGNATVQEFWALSVELEEAFQWHRKPLPQPEQKRRATDAYGKDACLP